MDFRTTYKTENISIGDYTIYLQDWDHPGMEGTTIGYSYRGIEGDIFIEKGLSATSTYETCVHEHLHDLGIRSSDHDWIRRFEDQLYNPICLQLLYRLNGTSEVKP